MGVALGSVPLESASVSGALQVENGQAVVRGGAIITARDHTAELHLNRGGVVEVCSTSSLHVTSGNSSEGKPPLLLALDRGALEIRTTTTPRDVVITPDLRFSITGTGPLDLHLRVIPNGDTCVDNRGLQAPTLEIINQFGDERYQLRAGQHVLFEHGSLREVVDHENSPCGCPGVPVVSVASGLPDAQRANPAENAARPGATVSPTQAKSGDVSATADAAAQHPFPDAQSQGLAPENPAAAVPQAAPGEPHAQVAATLAYGEGANRVTAPTAPVPSGSPQTEGGSGGGAASGTAASAAAALSSPEGKPATAATGPASRAPDGQPTSAPTASAPAAAAAAPSVRAEAPPPPPAPPPHDVFHAIGRFFRRLFGGR